MHSRGGIPPLRFLYDMDCWLLTGKLFQLEHTSVFFPVSPANKFAAFHTNWIRVPFSLSWIFQDSFLPKLHAELNQISQRYATYSHFLLPLSFPSVSYFLLSFSFFLSYLQPPPLLPSLLLPPSLFLYLYFPLLFTSLPLAGSCVLQCSRASQPTFKNLH